VNTLIAIAEIFNSKIVVFDDMQEDCWCISLQMESTEPFIVLAYIGRNYYDLVEFIKESKKVIDITNVVFI
jgi:hypothetical protein